VLKGNVSFEILSLNATEERKENVRIVQTTSLQSRLQVYSPTAKLICSCRLQSGGRPKWNRLIKFIVGILV